ncbi:MAG TPA: gamma-glutamyl-gamma-aminobutyrate hydrolase family protein [Trueperaceae bacterium]|nr:gamma-glutamyl-gamma-aminobutyrate hydrolase family protein [Trueperaceae bacterium]
MRAPVIGITVHVAEVVTEEGHGEWRFQLAARYAKAVADAGGVPLLLPTHPDSSGRLEDVLGAIDALLLSGGGRLPGQYFHDNPDPSLRDTNPVRYDLEVSLVRAAWAAGMPLLGICRGHQTVAEALGGTIVRNLGAIPGAANHYQTEVATVTTHAVELTPGSALAGWVGETVRVNSFHRQVVDKPPPHWRVTARSTDGWVEAIEADRGFGIGTQFHPEWLTQEQPAFRKLFLAFVEAAANYRAAQPA